MQDSSNSQLPIINLEQSATNSFFSSAVSGSLRTDLIRDIKTDGNQAPDANASQSSLGTSVFSKFAGSKSLFK